MAVVSLVLVLLSKYVALEQFLINHARVLIALAPVLGRTALVLLFRTTTYVRPQGLGSLFANHLPRGVCTVVPGVTLFAVLGLYDLRVTLLLVLLNIEFLALRQFLLLRANGTTGDTVGALVEVTEAMALLAAVLID